MKQFWEVFMHSFKERVTSKVFIISTIVILIAEVLMVSLPKLKDLIADEQETEIVVMEQGNQYGLTSDILNKSIEGYHWSVGNIDNLESIKKEVKEGKIDGAFLLNGEKIKYFADIEDSQVVGNFSNFLKYIQTTSVIQSNNQISETDSTKILSPINIETELVSKDKLQVFAIIYAMIFFMYIGILAYGQSIGTAIASEKSSRVMEIMVTKVKPLKMMFGKLFGVGVSSLLQLAIGIIGAVILIKSGLMGDSNEILGVSFNFSVLSVEQIIYFVIFFILGYFVYASIYAILGASVSRSEDLAGLTLPVAFILIFSFIFSFYAMVEPNSLLAKILSFVPFSSSIAMFIRLSLGEVPYYQILLSVLILLATIILFLSLAARIYPSSVLRYSNKVNIIKALKLGDSNKKVQKG
ncbi:ABC transporter permease [Priestia endophytica]|uniref:ABC transporter permease n=1 Tax=Priestia endophytica TaxID=135735 RepID=UPI002E2248D2|nr:ABC transporter permease [Priestia endophytica]